MCSWCRYKKCLTVGMKPELVNRSVPKKRSGQRFNAYEKILFNDSTNVSDTRHKDGFERCLQKPSQAVSHYMSGNQENVNLSWDFRFLTKTLRGILWIKDVDCPKVSKSLDHRVTHSSFIPCHSYQIQVDILLDVNDVKLAHSLFSLEMISPTNEALPLSLPTREGHLVFTRDSLAIFNVIITSITKQDSSIIIMDSLTEDHWTRLNEIVKFGRILNEFWTATHQLTSFVFKDEMDESGEKVKYSCILDITVAENMKTTSNAIESLQIFRELCLEDQIIVVKESLLLIDTLVFGHTYDEEVESFVYSALNGNLCMCIGKERLQKKSKGGYGKLLEKSYASYLENFYEFLRKDFFVISILSVLIVFQDKSGISCSEVFEKERRYYFEILDAYIKAKVISNEWPLDRDMIWSNFHEIFTFVSRHASIFKHYLADQDAEPESH